MEQNDVSSIRQILQQFSTEQLDVMLNAELQKQPVDELSVQMILQILRERDQKNPVHPTPEVQQLVNQRVQEFQQRSASSQRSGSGLSLIFRVASIAAVLVLVLVAALPQEVSADSLWDRLARWTSDVVEFFAPGDNAARLEAYVFSTDHPGLQQVHDAVLKLGITDPVVPMWLPEGAELAELNLSNSPARSRVYSRFVFKDSEIIFLAQINQSEASRVYHGDGNHVKTYSIMEEEYHIFQNNGNWVAIWNNNEVECSIVMDCQEDTLYRVLKSIYEMED